MLSKLSKRYGSRLYWGYDCCYFLMQSILLCQLKLTYNIISIFVCIQIKWMLQANSNIIKAKIFRKRVLKKINSWGVKMWADAISVNISQKQINLFLVYFVVFKFLKYIMTTYSLRLHIYASVFAFFFINHQS